MSIAAWAYVIGGHLLCLVGIHRRECGGRAGPEGGARYQCGFCYRDMRDGRLGFVFRGLLMAILAFSSVSFADDATAKALLQQAITLNESAAQRTREALAALDETPAPPQPTNTTGQINLAAFGWAKTIAAHPIGLPKGMTYGEGIENGKRCCQWHSATFILHAWFPASATSVNGSSPGVKWYHFTVDSPTPHPWLSQYGWANTAQTPSGGKVYYKWTRTK